jgi:hypothetical protein
VPEEDDLDAVEEGVDGARTGRVAFAVIEALTLFGDPAFQRALEEALVPGARIERHNRTWLMGRVRWEGASLVGRIGFQTSSVAEVWDEDIRDFREDMLLAGTTSPFAIDPGRRRVAFQLRPGAIRVRSFTGALQALMNAASPVNRWRVAQEVEEVPFEDWAEQVDRVIRLRVRLRRPNPHYGDRERVRGLVEGANARMAQIVWAADAEALDGIDVNDAFVREAIQHAQTYGSYAAAAERRGIPTAWGSDQEAAAEERVVEADPVTREIPAVRLREQLGDDAQ